MNPYMNYSFPTLSLSEKYFNTLEPLSTSQINVLWEESQDLGKLLEYLEPEASVCGKHPRKCSVQSLSSQSTYLEGSLGSWGKLGIYPDKYERNDRADVKLSSEKGDSLAECDWVKHFGRNPVNKQHVELKLVLRNQGLCNLALAIGNHLHVQCLDLAHNYFSDVTALGNLRHLMNLDLSYNCLTETLSFKAPWNLTHVDLSHNYIKSIYDLTEFWSLVYLDLSYNEIQKIIGLENLKHLRNLNLSHNSITKIENLNDMNLLDLNLSFNKITASESKGKGLRTLKRLKILNLESNNISNLETFSDVQELQILIMDNNHIEEIVEVTHLSGMPHLTEVSLLNNSITKHKFYKSVVVDTMKGVRRLDGEEISLKDKANVWQKFGRYPLIRATKIYKNLLKIERLNGGPVIGPHIMPCDEAPLPMVILVGPAASGKSSLCFRAQYEYADFIYWAKLYTTAAPSPICGSMLDKEAQQNITGTINISAEEFCSKLRNGDFLGVIEFLGDSYGFCRSQLEKAVVARKLCLICSDLCMAKQLMLRRLFPVLVLAMPNCTMKHLKFNIRKYGGTLMLYETKNMSMVKPIVSSIIDKVMDRTSKQAPPSTYIENINQSTSAQVIYNSDGKVDKSLVNLFDGKQPDSSASLNDLPFMDVPSCPPVSVYTSTDNIPGVEASDALRPLSGILSGSKTNQQESKKKSSVLFQSHHVNVVAQGHGSCGDETDEKRVSFSDNFNDQKAKKIIEGDGTKYSISRTLCKTHPEGTSKAGINLSVISDTVFPKEDDQEEEIVGKTEPFKEFLSFIKAERDMYIDLSMSQPDLFVKQIDTDDVGLAMCELTPILRNTYRQGTSHLKDLPDYNNRDELPDWCRNQLCDATYEEETYVEEEQEKLSLASHCSSCDCVFMSKK